MVLVLNIMTQIANAVRFIHSHELVHRDLKPSNSCVPYPRRLILVLYSAETGFWRLADFGFTSRGTATRMQNTTWARGTEGYRAPELLRNKQFNNKVDIWSMGCILYELAANRRRFMFDYDVIVYYVNNTQLAVGLNGFFGEQDRVVLSKRFVRMTEREPDQRPSAATIYEEFRDLHEQKRSEELYTDTKTVEFPSDIVGEGRRVESLAEGTVWCVSISNFSI